MMIDLEQVGAVYTEMKPRHELFAQVLIQVMTHLVGRDLGIPMSDGRCFVQARPKSLGSVLEKVLRKAKDSGDEPLAKMSDLTGGRIVVPSREECRAVCRHIEELAACNPPLLVIDRANSYTTEPLASNQDRFGYRSTHFVITLLNPAGWRALGVDVPDFLAERVASTDPETARDLSRGRLYPYRFRAELQVRTLMEHLWAVESHDRLYKGGTSFPPHLIRQFARVAALLEAADQTMAEVREEIDFYSAQIDVDRSESELQREIAHLQRVLAALPPDQDPKMRIDFSLRVARMQAALGNWEQVLATLRGLSAPGARLLCAQAHIQLEQLEEAGTALRAVEALTEGQAAYWILNGERLQRMEEVGEASRCFAKAAQLAPRSPRATRAMLLQHLGRADSLPVELLQPLLLDATRNGEALAKAGLAVPGVWFDLCVFKLLGAAAPRLTPRLKEEMISDALSYALQGVTSSIHLGPIREFENAVRAASQASSLSQLAAVLRNTMALLRARREKLALIGGPGGAADPGHTDRQRALRRRFERFAPGALDPAVYTGRRVVVLAGSAGFDTRSPKEAALHERLVRHAFKDFDGVLICPGTAAGIGSLTEAIRQVAPAATITTYLPEGIESPYVAHPHRTPTTEAGGFSLHEPIMYWLHLLLAEPADVRLVGIGGGAIARLEYQLAAAMGCHVGLLRGSGREADALRADEYWGCLPTIHSLPADAWTLRLYVNPPAPPAAPPFDAAALTKSHKATAPSSPQPAPPHFATAPADLIEALAQLHHATYLESQLRPGRSADPALSDWKTLRDDFKLSNTLLAQASLYYIEQLGYRLIAATDENRQLPAKCEQLTRAISDGNKRLTTLEAAQAPASERDAAARAIIADAVAIFPTIEDLCRREHARWNYERLVLQGWRYAPKTDKANKLHADLVSWEDLDERTKLYDLEAIAKTPAMLTRLGFGLRAADK